MSTFSIQQTVQELYTLVARLEAAYPGRRFTLDGHLVGSIGEVLAAERYGLELLPASTAGHDAVAPDGRKVQVKATQRSQVGLRSCPEHLIVLYLGPEGEVEEVYNGPGKPAWAAAGKMQSNGQRAISTTRLAQLQAQVAHKGRIPPV